MEHRKTQYKLILAHFLVAIIATSMQPLLPVFQAEFSIGLLQSSILPLSITFSIMISNLFMGFLISRLGQKTVLQGGVAFLLVAIIIIFLSNGFVSLLLGFSLVGLSAGACFTALVTVYSDLPREYQNFGIFHGFFGLGGMVSPLFTSIWLKTGQNIRGLFAIYALLFIGLLILLHFSKEIENQKFRDFGGKKMAKALSSPLILISVLLLALYAGVEVGATTWSVNSNMSLFGLDQGAASFILSGFWLAFTLSRMSTDFVAKKVGSLRLVVISSILGAIIIVLWVFGISPYLFAIIGLAIGPIFPVVQKEVNNRLPREQKGLFNGVAYLGTGIAASVFIPFMGALGEISLFYSYIPLVVNMIIVAILVYFIKKK